MGALYYPHCVIPSNTSLYYGLVHTGSIEVIPLTVTNVTENQVTLFDFHTSNPDFYTSFNPADSLLLPGDSLIVTVSFAPSAAGSRT